MLFTYTYVPHKMQSFIDFIFFEVWCRAPGHGDFRLELFDADAELREVMQAFFYSDKENADFFYGSVEQIYGQFSELSVKQIRRLKWWYVSNNNVERLCRNESGCHATLYSDIERKFPNVAGLIKKFFTGLYGFDAAALKHKVGDINDHYQEFLKNNPVRKCPFCGLGDIKGEHHSKREAYDHYLPKFLYPFNSINFRNLAPACHECNSSYKGTKDPARDAVGRRKAFYPYAAARHNIEITIDLAASDIDQMVPEDIQIRFGPTAVQEEIDTWKEVYGIEERYKAKCCDGDAMDWLEQMRILRDDRHFTPTASLATVQQQAEKSSLANSNFLKRAYLEGCERAGLFALL